MKRLLFVDDDVNVLQGLRHRLRSERLRWDMHFTESGAQALTLMDELSFDVIVSDMRMPAMDGSALLQQVRQRHPKTARIVLTGHASEGALLRTMAIAHQCLTKPCDVTHLKNVITRITNLHALTDDDALRATVGKITGLPAAPGIYAMLMSKLADDNATTKEIATVLNQDQAMCAKMLQIVNSAFFNLSRPITRIEDAVIYLGLGSVRQLALIAEVFPHSGKGQLVAGLDLERLRHHSMLTGSVAASMFDSPDKREQAFLAGLLHDIGLLLLATELPDRITQSTSAMQVCQQDFHTCEKELFGVTHAEVGAYLLGLWQIPFQIVEAVAHHHCPDRVPDAQFDILSAVHIADNLASEVGAPVFTHPGRICAQLDMDYLSELGVSNRLDEWRQHAAKLAKHLETNT